MRCDRHEGEYLEGGFTMRPFYSYCFWCPTCGWVETRKRHLATCQRRGLGFGNFLTEAEWLDDRDDLAMALELATLIAEDNDDFFTFYHADAEWLRAKVIAALRGG